MKNKKEWFTTTQNLLDKMQERWSDSELDCDNLMNIITVNLFQLSTDFGMYEYKDNPRMKRLKEMNSEEFKDYIISEDGWLKNLK